MTGSGFVKVVSAASNMSSPSEAQSVKSVTVSSPLVTDAAYEDTASSALGMGPPPDVTVQFISNAPNAEYKTQMRDVRTCSASPRPRRTISPSRLSVAQRRAQIAEMKVESVFSGVGVVPDQTHHVQAVAEAAIAEVRSVREEVSSRIAEVAKCVDVSASSVAEDLTGKVQQVAAYSDAQTSCSVETMQL